MSIQTQEGLDDLMNQLRKLISGYHPKTNKQFSETSDLKDPLVANLLIVLMAQLITQPATLNNVDYDLAIKRNKYNTLIQRQNNELNGKPFNHNTKWEMEDMRQLYTLFSKGTDVFQLADLLGRTTGSIIGKLKHLEVITTEEATQLEEKIYRANKEAEAQAE